jgi:hypothetical protein
MEELVPLRQLNKIMHNWKGIVVFVRRSLLKLLIVTICILLQVAAITKWILAHRQDDVSYVFWGYTILFTIILLLTLVFFYVYFAKQQVIARKITQKESQKFSQQGMCQAGTLAKKNLILQRSMSLIACVLSVCTALLGGAIYAFSNLPIWVWLVPFLMLLSAYFSFKRYLTLRG